MADSLSDYMDEYLAADAEGKAEIIGRVTVEAAMLLTSVGGLSRAGLSALRTAAQSSKLGKMTLQLASAVKKLGLKGQEEIADFAEFARRTLGNEVGSIGGIGRIVDKAKGASREIVTLKRQLQKKFNHAKDFGVNGSANQQTLNQFSNAITSHVKAPTTRIIEGTYRQTQRVIHYVDPSTGLNVIKDYQGKFISSWKLSPEQLRNVLERGSL